MHIRNEVERIIKEQNIDRKRAFEVSKTKYASIIKKIENIFVAEGQGLHWSNMGYFKPNIFCKQIQISKQPLWYHFLPEIVPLADEMVYVLLGDRKKRKHRSEVKDYILFDYDEQKAEEYFSKFGK